MHNSTRKGGAVQTMQVLHTSPGLEDIWQLHWAYNAGLEYNAPGLYIANLEDPATTANVIVNPPPPLQIGRGRAGQTSPAQAAAQPPAGATTPAAGAPRGGPGGRGGGHTGPAFWIKVSASPDGSFTVTNTRNSFSKTYAARK